MVSNKFSLKSLLKQVLEMKASDLHLSAGSPPQVRIDGVLNPLGDKSLDAEESRQLCYEILTPEQVKSFEGNKELDLAIDLDKDARFRVNLFFEKGTVSGAFRPIASQIPSPQELGIPDIAMNLTEKPRGLVLVTGPTGSGKSTTLAAMIDQINQTRRQHIITIEDPIEYLHHSKNCLIVQRELGEDTKSFGAALKRVLRQDPDVVLIGEMRDLETISTAITVAETGHLVFATLHTNTAVETVNRIINVFPAHQQAQIRTQLSFILQGILSQQLIAKEGGGRALALEILLPTMAIRNLIRENKIHQMYAAMQTDQARTRMQTMNQCLTALFQKGVISRDSAFNQATDDDEIKKLLGS